MGGARRVPSRDLANLGLSTETITPSCALTHVDDPRSQPPQRLRKCPECGEPLTPIYKTKERCKYVAHWVCQNPECLVMKVHSRLNPRRLEVIKAHAL